jgi:phage terminase large subunit-like protein
MKDYAAIATQYARDVVELRVPACNWVRLACQRHLDDLVRAEAGWLYEWNPELEEPKGKDGKKGKKYRPANRICRFAELMPHIKGDWAARGERIRLEPWQVFILASIFGWVSVETKKRRFRTADVFVPRKNAKSTLAAVIGNYMLAVDGEFGAEVYSGATSRGQALEVFRPALLMTKASAEFRARFGVVANASNLSVAANNSKFEPVIGNPGDGASPSCAIVDEYHEHATAAQYDTMKTGMGARSQPLILVITTAGDNIGGPCYVHQVALQEVLEGLITDERRFGVIYTVDQGDSWTDLSSLIKANPNWGVSVNEETMTADLEEAIRDPRKQNTFKKKHLNIWVNAASPWVNLENLQRCGDPTLRMEQFRGERCCVGLDLASKTDIASAVWIFTRELQGLAHYYMFSHNYLPEAAVTKPENEHYQAWVIQGHLIQTPGNMIDLKRIQDDVEASGEDHVIEEIAIDAWGSREIAPSLGDAGHQVIDVPMTTRNLSEPMKSIQALIDAGRFHHDGNLATLWMFSNVEVVEDRNENVFPRKASAEKKIDAAVATILAHSRAALGDGKSQHSQAFVNLNAPQAQERVAA